MDGVQVILSVEDSLSAMALTDEKGHFRIDGLKEGAYELRLFFWGIMRRSKYCEWKTGMLEKTSC